MKGRTFNWISRIAGFIILLPVTAMLVIQIPAIQQKLADFAIRKVNEVFAGEVSLSGIHLLPNGMLQVSDLLLKDPDPYTEDRYGTGFQPRDTIFYVKSVSASFSLSGLFRKEGLHLGRVVVNTGQMNLVNEPDRKWTSNVQRMIQPKGQKDTAAGPNVFDIRKVVVHNFRYTMTNFKPGPRKHRDFGLNYQDLDVIVRTLKGHSMKLAGSIMTAVCDRCTADEKSGYHIENLTAKVRVGRGLAHIHNIHLVDQWSDCWIDSYNMQYAAANAFRHYTDEVRMSLHVHPESILGMKTIGYFSGSIPNFNAILRVHECHAEGVTNALRIHCLDFTDIPTGVSGMISGDISDAAEKGDIGLEFIIKGLSGTGNGLYNFAKEFFPGIKLEIPNSAKKERFNINASSRGSLDKMKVSLNIRTGDMGKLAANATFKNLRDKNIPIKANFNLETNKFDIGVITGKKTIGPMTLEAGGNAVLGKDTKASLDSLNINMLNFHGYDYSGIKAQGKLEGGNADARLSVNDPNLQLDINVTATGRAKGDTKIEADSYISKADLAALKLWKAGKKLDFNGSVNAALNSIGEETMATMDIAGLEVETEETVQELGDFSLSCYLGTETGRVEFYSDYADLEFNGNKSFKDIFEDIKKATICRELPALFPKAVSPYGDIPEDYEYSAFDMDLNFHDTRDILSAIAPGVYIADSTNVNVTMNGNGNIEGNFKSSRLAYGKTYLKNLDVNVNNDGNNLSLVLSSSMLSKNGFQVNGASFSTFAHSNSFSMNLHYDGLTGDSDSMAELYVNGDISRTASDSLIVNARPLASLIRIGGQSWDISGDNVGITQTGIGFAKVLIACGKQRISIDGDISKKLQGGLDILIDDVNLEVLDHLNHKNLKFAGILNGKTRINSLSGKDIVASIDADLKGLNINGIEGGDFTVNAEMNSDRAVAYVNNATNGRNALQIKGNYVPETKEIDARLMLDKFQIGLISPFLKNLFDRIDGNLNGEVDVRGTTDEMEISSRGTKLDNVRFQLASTGVQYTMNGPIHLDNEGVWFDDIQISDSNSGKATLSGALRHDHFRKINLDAYLSMNGIQAISKPDKGDGKLYGMLAASGNAHVTGPFNDLTVDANVSTSNTGEIHVPLNNSLKKSNSELLSFVQPEKAVDPYEQMIAGMEVTEKKAPANFGINAHLNVRPDVTAYIELDKSMGNMLNVNGDASLDLDYRPAKEKFALNGEYNISGGKFHFETAGLIDKAFTIKPGGSIKFAGDIMNAAIDVTANYTLRASLSSLISDSTSVSSRRNVTCGITISGRLRNPEIKFSIDVPDLDPTTKAKVESALNTEDKVQKQFVALLMLGAFIPSDQFGVVNGTNMLYSNVSEIMMGQVNSILQKLEIPVDLGFKYQQNTSGKDIFDVAISTQLFNNRVIVNGSVGNRQYQTSSSAADVVGDLDISIKLDKNGQILLSLFSHSSDSYTSFLDNSQRNGVGISFQKEYDHFPEFVKSIFTSKKKREEQELQMLNSEKLKTTINVGKETEKIKKK